MNKLSLKSVFTPFFLLIFSAMFLNTLTDQLISKKIEVLVSSKDGLNGIIWAWGAASLLSAILFPMLIAILCSYNIVNTKEKAVYFLADKIELSVVETLRSWGKSFIWSFVFILPGIWKFIQYSLSTYVVLFSEKYNKGEVDALEYSTRICKMFWKQVNWWLTVFYLFVPTLIYVFAEPYRILSEHPYTGTLIIFLRTMSEYLFHYMMLKIFIGYINENENNLNLEKVLRGNNGTDV